MAKIVDRLLLFIYSLAILIGACCALAVAFNWIPYETAVGFAGDMYNDAFTTYTSIAVCAVIVLISIRLLYITLRRGKGQVPSIDQRTEFGDIRISLDTVENLALKAAGRVRGIKDLKSRVRVASSGLEITIRTLVDGESSIPAMTEEIQSQVKSHIEEITGIPVATVSVFIANVAQTSATFKSRVE